MCPDFNAPGSSGSQTADNHSQPLSSLQPDNNILPFYDMDLPSSSSEDDLPQDSLPQPQMTAPCWLCFLPPLLPTTHSRLSELLPPLPLAPQPNIHNMSHPTTSGVAAMPTPQSKLAPYFTGDIKEPISKFLQEYEELADSNGLTSRQKVETVVRYINPTECDLWQSLPGYICHDWDNLCDNLCEEYINPTLQGRYSKQKLLDFASCTTQILMADEQAVLKYYQAFNKLSKPLLDSSRITQGKHDATFWCSFHPEDCKALHEHLIAKQPDKPRGQAFDYKDILKITRAIFSGDNDFLLQEPPPRQYDSDCT
jgi:hypothetical protein